MVSDQTSERIDGIYGHGLVSAASDATIRIVHNALECISEIYT
jgi:hypothetical protein